MPANPLTMYAVLTIPKEVQFSEEARVAEATAGFRSYTTTLLPARTLEEVEAIAENWIAADGNFRVVIYDLGDPIAMKRLSRSSVAERPHVVLERDGDFA